VPAANFGAARGLPFARRIAFRRNRCLRLFQRAAEDDKTILVHGTMNANSGDQAKDDADKEPCEEPSSMGVLKPRCTTARALTRQ
jgi:hypothetical protein